MALFREDITLPALLGDWTPSRLLAAARMSGFVRRRRKKDVWVLVWVLALGFSVGARRCLTGLHHSYCRYVDETVTFGAFQRWFSAEVVALLSACLTSYTIQNADEYRTRWLTFSRMCLGQTVWGLGCYTAHSSMSL